MFVRNTKEETEVSFICDKINYDNGNDNDDDNNDGDDNDDDNNDYDHYGIVIIDKPFLKAMNRTFYLQREVIK